MDLLQNLRVFLLAGPRFTVYDVRLFISHLRDLDVLAHAASRHQERPPFMTRSSILFINLLPDLHKKRERNKNR